MPVFLFTDIEGSTRLWEKHRQAMPAVLRQHDQILEEELIRYGGRIIDHMGDGIYAIFEAGMPLHCVVAIQKRMSVTSWPAIGELRIRMGLNGRPDSAEGMDFFRDGDDYFGPVVNYTARIMNSAWGGQILLTPEVIELSEMPEEADYEDLGAHQLKSLDQPQRLLSLLHPELTLKKFPPPRSLSARPNNLPVTATPFIGRSQELQEIKRLLANPGCRLLTLIGPGGIGKTRLAMAAASAQLESEEDGQQPFDHGIYFIPLAPLASAKHIIPTIADSLRFSFYAGGHPKDQLIDYLREKEMLLVFDNFEHLITGSDLLSDFLNGAPGIKILATSRERLNTKFEWTLQIAGMDFPQNGQVNLSQIEEYSAVRLFIKGLHRHNPGYVISDEDRAGIIRICQLLEGMPLGIELASSWTRALSCQEIVGEIEHNLTFLASTMRDAPERHRSLTAVFEHSWSLLAGDERRLFARLSVFRHSFSREAAEKVASASLSLLTALMDKSLLRRTTYGRYQTHVAIRQFAATKLAEDPADEFKTRSAHCTYYGAFLKQRENQIRSRQQKQVLTEVRTELENIRTGWRWALQQVDLQVIGQYMTGLYHYYWIRGWLREGSDTFESAVDRLQETGSSQPEQRAILGQALARQGGFSYMLGWRDTGRELLRRSLAIATETDSSQEVAFANTYLGATAYLQGNYELAKTHLQEGLAISRQNNDRLGTAIALHHLGMTAHNEENYELAQQMHQESLGVAQEMGEPFSIAVSLNNLGVVAYARQRLAEAKGLHRASLTISREIDSRWGIAKALSDLARVNLAQEDYEAALENLDESHTIYKDIGDRRRLAMTLKDLSLVAEAMGNQEYAQQLLTESLTVLAATDS